MLSLSAFVARTPFRLAIARLRRADWVKRRRQGTRADAFYRRDRLARATSVRAGLSPSTAGTALSAGNLSAGGDESHNLVKIAGEFSLRLGVVVCRVRGD